MRGGATLRTATVIVRAAVMRTAMAIAALSLSVSWVETSVAAQSTRFFDQAIDSTTWVDHDTRPIRKPLAKEKNLGAHQFKYGVMEPLSHAFDIPDKILWVAEQLGAEPQRQAVNVNAYDEVPNSTWFTNRNHLRAVSLADIRHGPFEDIRPTSPYQIKSVKRKGVNPGFTVKDAKGVRWVVKFDPPGNPQLGSGADAIVNRLIWAAGYNVPHDVPFTFRASELSIDDDVRKGKDGDPPFGDADLTALLARGHRTQEGVSYAQASQYLPGKPLVHIDFHHRRRADGNDRFTHQHRRELRGLYVLAAWVSHWDTKDHQTQEMFAETKDTLGHVVPYILDLNATLGAAAEGPKKLQRGYEYTLDWGWILKRFVTLGFIVEPWRRARQESGIPSVGNFTADQFDPDEFKTLQENAAFHERTHRDSYWGAKLVSSFSDAQIGAAVDAAGYEDPRAAEYVKRVLIERRDKVARYWFGRVAPLDFFHVEGGALRFHDLAVDRGYAGPRRYEARVTGAANRAAHRMEFSGPSLPLGMLGESSQVRLKLSIVGEKAKPTTVDLIKKGDTWMVAGVRHA